MNATENKIEQPPKASKKVKVIAVSIFIMLFGCIAAMIVSPQLFEHAFVYLFVAFVGFVVFLIWKGTGTDCHIKSIEMTPTLQQQQPTNPLIAGTPAYLSNLGRH